MGILNLHCATGRPRPVTLLSADGGALARRIVDSLRSGNVLAPLSSAVAEFAPLLPLYGDLADDECYFQLVRDIAGLETIDGARFPGIAFDPQAIFEAIRHEPRGLHRIVWELMLRAGEHYGVAAVLDRPASCGADDAMALAEALPEMLFLHLCSARADAASLGGVGLAAYRAARALKERYPARILTIRLEAYEVDAARALRQICDFLGLRFSTGMLARGDAATLTPSIGVRAARGDYLAALRDYMGDAC